MKLYIAIWALLVGSSSFAAGNFRCDLLAPDGSIVRNGRTFVDMEKALFTVGRGSVLDYLLSETTVQPPDAPERSFGRTECTQTKTTKDQVVTHSFKCFLDVDDKKLGLEADLVFSFKSSSGEYRGVMRDGSNDKFAVAFKNCQFTR